MMLALSLSLSSLLVASRSRAEQAPAPPASPPPSAPLPPSQPPVQPPIVLGEHTCFVGAHAGIDDADARTTTDLVCVELAPHQAPAGIYDVRFGKLGSRVLLGVTERASGNGRRVLIQSFDEVPVAAPRLVAALVDHKSLEETQNVDNVVASESRKRKTKTLATSVDAGLLGVSALGVAPNASAGLAVGLTLRNQRWALASHLRGGGIGSGSNKLGFVGIDIGARYYYGDGDTAPFLGGGFALSYMKVNREVRHVGTESGYSWQTVDFSPDGSGLGAYVEGGLELLRSSHTGIVLSVRGDAPFYVLENETRVGTGSTAPTRITSRYVVPVSLGIGFSFH